MIVGSRHLSRNRGSNLGEFLTSGSLCVSPNLLSALFFYVLSPLVQTMCRIFSTVGRACGWLTSTSEMLQAGVFGDETSHDGCDVYGDDEVQTGYIAQPTCSLAHAHVSPQHIDRTVAYVLILDVGVGSGKFYL